MTLIPSLWSGEGIPRMAFVSIHTSGWSFTHLIDYTSYLDHTSRLENRRSLVRSPTRPISFLRIDDGHCNRFHSSLTDGSSFYNGYVGKQPVAWKEYCAECWLKELQESMDRCTGRNDITEILSKTALNTNQLSIYLSVFHASVCLPVFLWHFPVFSVSPKL